MPGYRDMCLYARHYGKLEFLASHFTALLSASDGLITVLGRPFSTQQNAEQDARLISGHDTCFLAIHASKWQAMTAT